MKATGRSWLSAPPRFAQCPAPDFSSMAALSHSSEAPLHRMKRECWSSSDDSLNILSVGYQMPKTGMPRWMATFKALQAYLSVSGGKYPRPHGDTIGNLQLSVTSASLLLLLHACFPCSFARIIRSVVSGDQRCTHYQPRYSAIITSIMCAVL